MTTEAQALLRAIRANPKEDTPRLMYADEIGPEQPFRAEFIRVQITLANLPPDDHQKCRHKRSLWCSNCRPLRERQYKLWQQHLATQDDWDLSPEHVRAAWHVSLSPYTKVREPVAILHRGFVDTIHCSTSSWIGYPCGECGGSGNGAMFKKRVSKDCRKCDGTGRVGACCFQIRQTHPVTRVVLTDAVPWAISSDSSHHWYDARRTSEPVIHRSSELPGELFERLRGGTLRDSDRFRWYAKRQQALTALSDACLHFAARTEITDDDTDT